MRSAREQDNNKSTASFLPLTPRRSMEEVWRNITMSSILHHEDIPIPPPLFLQHHRHNHHHHHNSTATAFRGVIFQDFLSGGGSGSVEAPPPPPSLDGGMPLPSHPATALCLNTAPHHPLHHSDTSSDTSYARHHQHPTCNLTAFSPDSIAGSPCPPTISFCAENRALEKQLSERFVAAKDGDSSGSTDRRQKRMIKNRESAARSRARKQAYTNELELEVAHLEKENAKLRKQYNKLRMAMDAQVCTKKTLKRSSTAPF